MSEKVKNLAVESIIQDLESGNEAQIIAALEKIPEKGNAQIIEALLECFDETSNQTIKERIKQILCELKDTSCIDPMMDYFRIAESETREMIINAFWNNNLNPYSYVDVFIEAAIIGSYMEAFEVLTLIENIEIDSDINTK
ncbi:MAG: hypothetical protein ACLGGV_09680, partial [Bacteroidia bacterium]